MATVIESLIVTLGLDATNFRRGTADATRARNTLGDTNRRQDAETSAREKKLAAEQARRGKEAEARAKAMADGFRKVRNEALSLFALFTAGVGIKNFIANTVESAVQLGYLSQNLKMSVEQLQAYGRAAERMGGSSEAMFSQIKESADSLAQLRSGMGPNESIQWFFRLGGSDDDLTDAMSSLRARAKIISEIFKTDPAKAALFAKQLGVREDMFDALKKGPDAFEAMAAAQMKNSAITEEDTKKATILKEKYLDFTQALTATTTKIVVSLIPAFTQVMEWLAKLAEKITENREKIAKWIDNFVKKAIPALEKFGKWLSDLDWEGASDRLGKVADAVIAIADALTQVIELWNEWIGKKGQDGKITVATKKALDPNDRFGPEAVAADNARKKRGEASVYSDLDMWIKRMEARVGNQEAKEFIRDSTGIDEFGAGTSSRATRSNSNFSALEKKYNLPSGLLDSVWKQESSRGKNMLSPKGAQGHFGFMPKTAAAYGLKDPNNLEESSDAAARMYRDLLKSNGGNLPGALASYNWGSGNVARQGMGAAPKETRDYISSVMGRMGASNAAQRGNSSTSTSTSDVKIGSVNIQTQATDAKGMAADAANALRAKFRFSDQANSGMQ